MSREDREIVETLQEAVAALGPDAAADHPLVEACNRIMVAYRDKAALLKREWTDEMFQGGEDVNEERVAELEAALASALSSSGGGLEDGGNLGGALDLVGVYMKNYKLDKADAVLSRCGFHVRSRGGVWMVKWLNHTSTVRMKQGRHLEALEMLYDLELHSPYSAVEAPEFFETLYRNFAWALKSLGRIDDAAAYFAQMARASEVHKGGLDWFDRWDLGKLTAARAYRDGDMPRFRAGRAMIGEALRMQEEAEPGDLVMRAKVHDSLAECFLVAREYGEAERHYGEAYSILRRTVGRSSPLFGKQARHAANLHLAQGKDAEALPFLQEALLVEAGKDAASLPEAAELLDLMAAAQQRCAPAALEALPSSHPALKLLQARLSSSREEPPGGGGGGGGCRERGVLCHKMSLLYLHEARRDPRSLRRAARLAKASVRALRECGGEDRDAAEWRRVAEVHLRMLASVPRHGPSSA